MAGRYKLNDQGAYFDPNDEGVDQASPEQIAAIKPQSSGLEDQMNQMSDQQHTPAEAGGVTGGGQTATYAPSPAPAAAPGGANQSAYTPTITGTPSGITANDPKVNQGTDQGAYGPDPRFAAPTSGLPSGPPSYPGSDNDPLGVNYSNYLRQKQGLPPKTAEEWGWSAEDIAKATSAPAPQTGAPAPAPTPTPAPAAPAAPSPSGGAVPAGFTAEKWNNPDKHDPKYDVGHMVAEGKSNEEVAAMLAQKYPGYTVVGGDKIKDDKGDVYDFRYASKESGGVGQPMWEFTGEGPSGQGGGGAGGGGAAGGPGGTMAPFQGGMSLPGGVGSLSPQALAQIYGNLGGAGGGSSTKGPLESFGTGEVGDALRRLLGRGEAPLDLADPNIAGPTAAYRAQVDRATGRSRNALAERSAAEGTNEGGAGGGAFDSAIQSQIESGGINVANFQGKLQTDEIAAKRQDVVNALQMAQGEQKIYLEQYLAQLNDQLQRAQMGQQNQQYYDEMGYRMGKDQADMDRAYYEDMQKNG